MLRDATSRKETNSPSLAGGLDRRRASFDKLRMWCVLCATKNFPQPERFEGRRIVLPWNMIAPLSLAACGKQGPPEPPAGKTDKFPRQYPDPSSL